MTISKKGYLFMILFLGIAVTGVSLIAAHPFNQYSGLGASGIHATPDGDIHIPGDIIFDSNSENSVTITHNATSLLNINILDLNGSSVVMPDINITSVDLAGSLDGVFNEETGELTLKLEPITCGLLQGLKGVDANGNLFCAVI